MWKRLPLYLGHSIIAVNVLICMAKHSKVSKNVHASYRSCHETEKKTELSAPLLDSNNGYLQALDSLSGSCDKACTTSKLLPYNNNETGIKLFSNI
jgi:hypothetical protein